MTGSPVRVAVVGAGYIGRIHAKAVARIAGERPGLAELAYVADVDYSRAKAVAEAYGGRPVEGLAGELARADLAIVATPTPTHRSVVERLAGLGVEAFLVEKPLAASLPDAAALASRSRRLWISAGHSERFNPTLRAASRAAMMGLLDSIDAVETRRIGPYTPRAASTDVIHDLAIHDFDIILSLLGLPPRAVNAAALEGIVSDLPDYALVTVYFDGVASGTVVSRMSPIKERVTRAYSGGRSLLEMDFLNMKARVYGPRGPVEVEVEAEEPIYLEDLAVIEALAAGSDPPVPPQEALVTLYLCEKALESHRRGARIVVGDDPDYQRYRGLLEEGLDLYAQVKRSLLGPRA